MKTKLHFLLVLLLSTSFIQGQESTANISMGAGYTNQVYYKLSTETATSFAANSWDIALLRTSAFAFALRVNDGIGIQVFEASNTISDWNAIDVNNEASWAPLYNSDTSWNTGAFDNGSATYGWGEYNVVTHHVEGSIIFVLKYADGSYIKFINEDFYGGYTFRYSKWDDDLASWGADQTATVANTSNANNTFNYYSLQENTEVVAEPAATNWDLKFTKYYTELAPNTPYLVTGVLHNEGIEVAKNDEPIGMPINPDLTYATAINTIGYDWKTFDFSVGYIVDSEKVYYIKDASENIYRLYFTAFAGTSTGAITFKFENVTSVLSTKDVSKDVTFGIYPNPSTDKKVNLIYDINTLNSNNNNVVIYSVTGQKVLERTLAHTSGFYSKTLDLSSLKTGIYVLEFSTGIHTVSKKLILK